MKKRKCKRVGVDVDGVLGDFESVARRAVRELYGREFGEVVTWDFLAEVIPPEETRRFWEYLGNPGYFHSRFTPFPGAGEGFAALYRATEVYIVTSPPRRAPTWTSERDEWLERIFGIPYSRIVHTAAKHTFLGDALVDDRVENIEAWAAEEIPGSVPILWDMPYNREETRFLRTRSWHEVLRIVTGGGGA